MKDHIILFINSAVIFIGGYCLPVSVLFGAVVGASIFIMSRQEIGVWRKLFLFLISFLCGVFAGEDITEIVNKITPQHFDLGEFTGAALASALSIVMIEMITRLILKRNHLGDMES